MKTTKMNEKEAVVDPCYKNIDRIKNLPALSGLGTPPTNTVFLGSSGSEASRT